MADLLPIYLIIVAFLCTAGAIALALFHIYKHLLNYTEPIYQRYIVRIVFMVPVSFSSFNSFLLFLYPDLCTPFHVEFSPANMFLILLARQVYALMSFLALVLPKSSIYFNSIREV